MWSDNETDRDLLGFKVHADLIESVVTNEQILPISVGVFGDWGSGKSSIMKILEKKLNDDSKDDTACLYFNGWTFEGYDDAKAALIEDILIKLKENEKFGHKIKDEATKLLKSVNWLRAGGFLMKNVAKPALLAYATGGASLIIDAMENAKNFFEDSSEDPAMLLNKMDSEKGKGIIAELKSIIKNDDANKIPTVVRKFRDDFEKTIKKTGLKSLVILIDDLDRCNPERIIDNLEAIKLFLNVPRTAFIIGADERIVRHAIESRYRTSNIYSTEIEQYKGVVTDYLEKLIQLPYRLPRLSNSDVETYMTLLFCNRDLSEEDFKLICHEFESFRENDRHSCFNYEKVKSFVTGKKNTKGKDVDQQLLLVKRIAPMVTSGLKGNPRQIKRFLNTFTLRLELAEVANFDLDEEILAKLMVLEYAELDLFKELCDWQQIQHGKPQEIEWLENSAKNGEEQIKTKHIKWDEEFVLKWLNMEPSLKDVNLMDYYWIARDKLINTIDAESMVSQIVRLVYKSLTSYTTQKSLDVEVEKIKDLANEEKEVLFKMLCRDLMKNPENDRYFEITHSIIRTGHGKMTLMYKTVLEDLNKTGKIGSIPPGISISLNRIMKAEPIIKEAIDKFDGKTKLAKALNFQHKKK